MRKSIFDIASASINISNEVDRIVSMSAKEKSTYSPPYDLTLFEFIDKCCFRDWSYRGHFVNVVDFLGFPVKPVLDFAKHSTQPFFRS